MARNPARTAARAASRERFSIFRFFVEVYTELRRVSWPTRQEATRLTVLVMIVSAFFGLLLGGVDLAFARLFQELANT